VRHARRWRAPGGRDAIGPRALTTTRAIAARERLLSGGVVHRPSIAQAWRAVDAFALGSRALGAAFACAHQQIRGTTPSRNHLAAGQRQFSDVERCRARVVCSRRISCGHRQRSAPSGRLCHHRQRGADRRLAWANLRCARHVTSTWPEMGAPAPPRLAERSWNSSTFQARSEVHKPAGTNLRSSTKNEPER